MGRAGSHGQVPGPNSKPGMAGEIKQPLPQIRKLVRMVYPFTVWVSQVTKMWSNILLAKSNIFNFRISYLATFVKSRLNQFLFSPDELEEWVGDLKEIQYQMNHVEKRSPLVIFIVIKLKYAHLCITKMQCLIFDIWLRFSGN